MDKIEKEDTLIKESKDKEERPKVISLNETKIKFAVSVNSSFSETISP